MDEVLRKMRFKPEYKSLGINIPEQFLDFYHNKGFKTGIPDSGPYEFVHVFATRKEDIASFENFFKKQIKYDAVLWVSYPKGGSKISTELNRNTLWEAMKPFGLRPVTQVSVDSDWSALRFRPVEAVK